MEEINAFSYSKLKIMEEKPLIIKYWINTLIIILVLFIILSTKVHYKVYSNYIAYIENNNSYNLKIIINDYNFPIKKNYKLYIDNKKYNYKIISIEAKEGYYELLIRCNIEKNLLINNNIITVRFETKKTTLAKELIEKIKKGMN